MLIISFRFYLARLTTANAARIKHRAAPAPFAC